MPNPHRGYVVYGEFIVYVSGGNIPNEDGRTDLKVELGLTADPVRILPRYNHRDVYTDDFGPDTPVETLWNMGEAALLMTLVHYNPTALSFCMSSAMGGPLNFPVGGVDGFMAPGGTAMGRGRALGVTGNSYMTVYLQPAQNNFEPYRFLACYLDSKPLEIPYGTERTLARLNWRVIPYQQLTTAELSSAAGVTLWDHSTANPAQE